MKALKNPFLLTIITLLLSSCYTSRSAYSQGNYNEGYADEYGYADTNYDNYDNGGINFNVFYNELSPYGSWVNDRDYGRVWVPNVGNNFHPYATNGYWAMTDYGNTWVSDYPWGWAPFHYGRWFHDDYYGWAWMPGYEWAPAWVSWRSGGGYYGWAPMGPSVHINIHVNVPSLFWTFLPNRYMYHRNMHKHYNRYSPHIYNRTTIINNTYVYNDNRYYSGPSASDYRRETGRTATVRRLESTTNRSGRSTSVSSNAVSIYRPEVSRERNATRNGTVNERAATTRSATTRSATTRSRNESTKDVTPANRESRATRSRAEPQRSTSGDRNEVSTTKRTTTDRSATVSPQRSTSSNNNEVSTTKRTSSERSATVTPQRSTSGSRNTSVSTQRSSGNTRATSSGSDTKSSTERSSTTRTSGRGR